MQARNAKSDLPVKVYTPESRLRRPRALLNEIVTDLLSSRELAWQFFYRQISSRYRQSALGPFWALIPPTIIAITSTVLRRSGVIAVDDTGIPYPLYVMFGSVLWQLFANSLALPLKAMKSGLQLLRTIRVPVEGLLLASVAEMLFDFSIQFLVLMAVFALFKVSLSWAIFLAFGAMAMLVCLGIGLGLFLVPLGSLYTDVSAALPFITRFWFFLTPVIYTPPERWPYSLLVDLNPVTPLLTTALDLSIEGSTHHVLGFWIMSAIAIVLVIVGWIFYRVAIPILVER